MNMSPSNLFRRVRETLGISPSALVNEMRLSKAKEILDGTEKDISEIVFLTGFNSHSYFSKCFRKRFGISPSEYMAEIKGDLTVK
ncbi:MAG: helix-turn-helix domain-containing protein [Candidatus Cryptobacteroides sp.]